MYGLSGKLFAIPFDTFPHLHAIFLVNGVKVIIPTKKPQKYMKFTMLCYYLNALLGFLPIDLNMLD